MRNQNHKRSKIAGTLWMGMAVFFLVFCSCPVKRFIRLHLYDHKSIAVNPNTDTYSTNDVKDCSIADRHQQSNIIVLSFLHRDADPHDLVTFLSPLSLSSLSLYFSTTDKESPGTISGPHGMPMPIPVYLWVRHIQV